MLGLNVKVKFYNNTAVSDDDAGGAVLVENLAYSNIKARLSARRPSQQALEQAQREQLKWEYEAAQKERDYQACLADQRTDCVPPEAVREILQLQKKQTRGISADIEKLLRGEKP